jgi:hypothetical protein
MRTITASFATRREAELAVEHLVQEHGVERSAISVRAAGEANTAGTEAAGADVESGHPGVGKEASPPLAGAVEVCVEHEDGSADVQAVLRELGASEVRAEA